MKGQRLSAEEAQALESRLAQDPEDSRVPLPTHRLLLGAANQIETRSRGRQDHVTGSSSTILKWSGFLWRANPNAG